MSVSYRRLYCPISGEQVTQRLPARAEGIVPVPADETLPLGWSRLEVATRIPNGDYGEYVVRRAEVIETSRAERTREEPDVPEPPGFAELIGAAFDAHNPPPPREVIHTLVLGPFHPDGFEKIAEALAALGLLEGRP